MSARSARLQSSRRVDYETLADLRYHVRRFLRVREEAARVAGVEPQQYVLLLQVKGFEGRRPATIGALTERLQIRHHATVQLVDRLAQRGLVRRRRGGWRLMTRMIAMAVGAAVIGVLAGFLWWGTATNRLRDEVRTLQNRHGDEIKALDAKLKKTEEELQSERERRLRLEQALSQGKK